MYLMMTAEFSRAQRRFEEETRFLGGEVKHKLDTNDAILTGFASFLQAVDREGNDSAARYAASAIAPYPHVYMLEVARRVARNQKQTFEVSMRKGWRADFNVRRFSEVSGQSDVVQETKDHIWPILFMYPVLPAAQAIYGVQLETVRHLASTLAYSHTNAGLVASPPFEMLEGEQAYILLKEVQRPVSSTSESSVNFFGNTMVALLLIKTQALIPNWVNRHIHFSAHLATHGKANSFQLFDQSARPFNRLDEWFLPHFKRSLDVGTPSQPVRMDFDQQLRWSDVLNPGLLTGIVLLGSTLSLVIYGMFRHYQMLNLAAHKHERAAYLATHDMLTGLPNRYLLADRFEQMLSHWKRHDTPFALLLIDLDCFKEINDTFGHAVGDEVLATTATRLQQCVRSSDTVARYGGDEFIVLLDNVLDAEGAKLVGEKLLTAVGAPINSTNAQLHVTCCVGVALCPLHGKELDTLRKAADQAMYRVKLDGRNSVSIAN